MPLYDDNLEALGEELKRPVNNQHHIAKHVDIMNHLPHLSLLSGRGVVRTFNLQPVGQKYK